MWELLTASTSSNHMSTDTAVQPRTMARTNVTCTKKLSSGERQFKSLQSPHHVKAYVKPAGMNHPIVKGPKCICFRWTAFLMSDDLRSLCVPG